MENNQTNFKLFILAIFALSVINCTDYSEDDAPDIIFPVSTGNTWNYETSSYLYFKPDSGTVDANTVYTDTLSLYSTIHREIIKDTLLNDTLPAKILYSVETEPDLKQQNYYSKEYLWNFEDGLYRYHTDLIKKDNTEKKKYRFKNIAFNNISELKAILNTRTSDNDKTYPWKLIKMIGYPLKVGSEWITEYSYTSFVRKIIGTETVITPAGTFFTYKIRTFWDLDENGIPDDDMISIDYFCGYGIVKTYIEFQNCTHTDEFNNILGYFDSFDTEMLTNFKVDL